jgi:S1-C subfamily serine protease
LVTLAIGIYNIGQISLLNQQLGSLGNSIRTLSQSQASTSQKLAVAQQEIIRVQNQPSVMPQSQDQLLTAAVAKVAPAVVSVVISEDVPNLQVTYENPFGNDPLFRDFGFQIPVYQQKGTTLQKVGAGSGFLISRDGYILTNKHVVANTAAEYTVLLSTGVQKTGTVVYRDPNNDIAVIKISGNYPTIAHFGDSASMKIGQTVVAIGNALGEYSNSVSVGIISGMNRTIQASDSGGNVEQLTGVLQTDASINPGNSGGPLIDLNGDIIGINVATVYGSSNISFSIPINTIEKAIHGYL